MSNLMSHARRELELAGFFAKEVDPYDVAVGQAALDLIDMFAKQGHSGLSASIV